MSIAVLFGGPSNESEVSYKSGSKIYNALKELGYKAEMVEYKSNVENKLRNFEKVFNIMHGKPGEDGIVQGLLEYLNIPYTGSGVQACAITINKCITQKIVSSMGIDVLKSVYIDEAVIGKDADIVKRMFENKVMVKPNTGGSSVGTIILNPDEAFKYMKEEILKYREFIVEDYLENALEITVGIIEEQRKTKVLTPLQLKPHNQFYDYKAKYTEGMTDFIIPPLIDESLKKKAMEISKNVFEYFNMRTFARVDFLIKNNNLYHLEINSIPGMTDLSDLPAEAKYDGIDYTSLIDKLLKTAEVKFYV